MGRSGLIAGLALSLVALFGAAPVAGATPFFGATGRAPIQIQRGPTAWPGGVELFRADAFTSQPNLYTCVPTAVQIMLNLINGTSNHSTRQISSFYTWGRAHNAYAYPTAGLDPASWSALLTVNGAGAYTDLSFSTYSDAIREAVLLLRETGKPVGLLVDHAHHAWVMTGFTASADPLRSPYVVTGVTIMGPLYPRASHGYDPHPGTHLTVSQLMSYFTDYREVFPVRWSGKYVIVAPALP